MWKIAQPSPSSVATMVPNRPVAASSHSSRKRISKNS